MRHRVISWILLLSIPCIAGAQHQSERRLDKAESAAVASPRPAPTEGSNTDLLSWFAAALQSYSQSGGAAITLEKKIPGLGQRLAGKAQLILRQPKLNEKFAEALSGQTALISSLEKDLNYDDDISFGLTIGPAAAKAEQQIEKALGLSAQRLVERTIADRTGERSEVRELRVAAANEPAPNVDNAAVAAGQPKGFAYLDALMGAEDFHEQVDMGRRDVHAAVVAMRTAPPAGDEVAKQVVNDVAVLAANQSKFTLDASYRDRHEMAGPDEWFVKAKYEWGIGTNVAKRLKENQSPQCAAQYRNLRLDDNCYVAVGDALKEATDDEDVKMGSRVTFALEYKEFSDMTVAQPVAFDLKGSKSLIYSLTAGRDLFEGEDLQRRGRLELSIAYDDVTDRNDPAKTRKDRLIGKLTYSQRVSDNVDVPITLTYANHDDYLTDVDRKLTAHFGVSYKIPNLTKKTAN